MLKRINIENIVIKPITNQKEFDEANTIIEYLVDADLIQRQKRKGKSISSFIGRYYTFL